MTHPTYINALEKLVAYASDSEYEHLLEELYSSELYDEENEEPAFDAMSELDLYLFCVDNNIDHIWVSVFQCQELLGSLKDER